MPFRWHANVFDSGNVPEEKSREAADKVVPGRENRDPQRLKSDSPELALHLLVSDQVRRARCALVVSATPDNRNYRFRSLPKGPAPDRAFFPITTAYCFCAVPLIVVPCSLSSKIHFMVLPSAETVSLKM